MKFFNQTQQEVFESLHTGSDGLSSRQALKRLEEYGPNTLTESKKTSIFFIFLKQFQDLLVLILICAAVISMISGNLESTLVIFAVIILNAILGTVQHRKAEKSLDSLKALSAPTAKVQRDGAKVEIPASQIVPGDILMLDAGDLISADARIIGSHSLQVNESSLTGESVPVEKLDVVLPSQEVALGDQKNMIFSGSLVSYGRGAAVVTATGMDTELGKIASLMNQTKEKKTPLQISLDQFGSRLAFAILVLCGIIFLLSLYRDMPILDSLMFAVALAVAAIPEALSSIVTIVQAMGTQKMVREHAIIKDLKAVESLGCVSIVCSDKTGTLTQNKMTVQSCYLGGQVLDFHNLNPASPVHKYFLYTALLANDSAIAGEKQIGDPTEIALLHMGIMLRTDPAKLQKSYPRIGELPFDSDRKLMSTAHVIDGQPVLLTKGAPDILLEKTIRIMTEDGPRPLTAIDKAEILYQNQSFSEQGLRVLALALRYLPDNAVLTPDQETDFIFLGLVSMIDPPRPESIDAVAQAKEAGIRTIMITGDHKITATAIAKQLGIYTAGDLALTGTELDRLTEKELDEKLPRISVYARVSPEHKIRIVDSWQRRGHITAMTGDGVNDAPALKKADIGVAMGITGTEVSKDAASMILTDDCFATIIKAVANGRNVYQNIKNAIQFLLSGNTAGILCVLFTFLLALPVPFAPVHLLFINLLTDSLPALAIGMEPAERGLLKQKPRDPKQGILTGDFLTAVLWQGMLLSVFTMAAYFIGMNRGGAAMASTMAFATLTLARLFHGFNCRNQRSVFDIGLGSNKYSIAAFGAGFLLLNAVLMIPGLQGLFSVSKPDITELCLIYVLAFLPTLLIQLIKVIRQAVRTPRPLLSYDIQHRPR